MSKIQEYVWVRLSDVEHFVQIEIFNIEEVFDTLCNQLDEILLQFAKFSFLLPIPQSKLTKEMAFIKEKLEDKLGIFQVITQEECINQKVSNGYFLTN